MAARTKKSDELADPNEVDTGAKFAQATPAAYPEDTNYNDHRSNGMRVSAASVAIVLLLSLGLGFLGGWYGSSHGSAANTSVQKQTVLNESQLISGIAKDVSPSVVSVNVTGQTTPVSFGNNPYDLFGQDQDQGQSEAQQSAGTGIIISDNVIITNRHVVPTGTSKVSVTLSDGTELDKVEVIGRTKNSDSLDVAFLKVNDTKGKKLKSAQLGDSSKMQVGDRVVAIGNALGQFQNTVTSGILSGHGRSVQAGDSSDQTGAGDTENLQDLFQTDAAINEGNSGGPLVNANGEVIGINTAVAGNAQNIGFSIPINDIQGLIKTVLKTGKFTQPYLGVRYVTITNDIADQLKLPTKQGAYILSSDQADGQVTIIDGSPAAKAGLQEKDIIQSVSGVNVDSNHSLASLLAQHAVGDTVQLKILRGKDVKTAPVRLETTPSNISD